MPRKQWECIGCGVPVGRRVKRCPVCHSAFLKTRPARVWTDASRQKIREFQTGRRRNYRSASTRPEVAEKIRQSWSPEKREAARQRGLLMAADRAWRDMIARSVTGSLNPRYQAKDQATPYAPGWGRLHKRLIRERAGYRCERCGQEAKRLHIHHKDWSKDNHHPENLQALCVRCHFAVHPRRNPGASPDAPRDSRGRFSPMGLSPS